MRPRLLAILAALRHRRITLIVLVVLVGLVVLVFIGGIGLPATLREAWRAGRISPSPTPTPLPTPTPTPTPTPKPIPTGKQTFSVSSGKKTGPQFTKGVINPYDPARGGKQTVSVSIRDTVPITSVTSTLTLDNGSKIESDMKLVEGTVTDGRWEATWQVVHPYLYTYNLLFIAKDSNDTSQVELTLR